ncbi:MAG: cupin [Pyrinomonadaceae bacterium]|nr:cupin [Pyrinomonadaceae bacterium]
MSVRHFTIKDPAMWHQPGDKQIFIGDVLDSSNSDTMSVGFCWYQKGESNEFIVTNHEALIVTRGVFTVRSSDGAKTAKVGEVIFLTKGTKVVYQGEEDDTEVVYVTYRHWMDAQTKSKHAHLLDSYHPV